MTVAMPIGVGIIILIVLLTAVYIMLANRTYDVLINRIKAGRYRNESPCFCVGHVLLLASLVVSGTSVSYSYAIAGQMGKQPINPVAIVMFLLFVGLTL